MNSTTHRSIAEIEAELEAAKAAEAAELEARRKSVTPVWKYTLEPHYDSFNKIWDETVVSIRLTGRCINAEEMVAVGNRRPEEGGMTYLLNTASGKIIGAFGGGRVYVTDVAWNRGADKAAIIESARQCFDELADFIMSRPGGGDVTSIIEAHNQRIGKI